MRLEAERAPAESYFEARERQRLGGGRTSRHILSRVPAARGLWGAASGIDRSIGAHIDAVGASLGDEPTPGEAALRPLFRQWRTLLDVGMSIVLHGLGSKGALLRAFASEALPDCHVISVSGHASESSPEKAMDACADLAGGSRVAFVAEDAQGVLRTPEHWSRLAALQAAGVYVVLSVEGVRGAAWAPADPLLAQLALPGCDIRWYGNAAGWHLREDALYRGDAFVMATATLPLPGRHNRSNLCAVLTALEAYGLDAVALAPHAASFQPLPNRLQALGEHGGYLYVNDSISTTPMATQAALEVYADRPVAVLVGGHDRGLPWDEFADAMRVHAPNAIITMGQNGPRIHALLAPLATQAGFALRAANDLADAMTKAREALPEGGVILLSPGAPSFGAYKNYVARGRHFAELAGFDPDIISSIAGMGIG